MLLRAFPKRTQVRACVKTAHAQLESTRVMFNDSVRKLGEVVKLGLVVALAGSHGTECNGVATSQCQKRSLLCFSKNSLMTLTDQIS